MGIDTELTRGLSRRSATRQYLTEPIDLGDVSASVYLLLYGTRIRYHSDLWMVTVTVGGESLPVTAAMAQGEYDGLDQINVGPRAAKTGRRVRRTARAANYPRFLVW